MLMHVDAGDSEGGKLGRIRGFRYDVLQDRGGRGYKKNQLMRTLGLLVLMT